MVKGITYILVNDSNVQALVGRNKANTKYKAYPGYCPQPEKYPYSVVRQTKKVPIECKGGDPNTYEYGYDVSSFHTSYDEVESLDDAVVESLSMPDGGTHNSVVFQDIRHVNTRDEIVQLSGSGTVLHVKVSSFEAMVNEDQAT
jgi:hypothetical protein